MAFILMLLPACVYAQANVVTSIKPLQLIAAAIVDGVSTPSVLIPANQSPHHFSLRPSDVRRIANADVVMWVGPGLETYLERVIDQSDRADQVLEAATLDGMLLLDLQEDAPEHDHGHAEDSHYDPHLWLNTRNAVVLANALVARLVSVDPTNASLYQSNLAVFESDMQALELRLLMSLDPLANSRYAVYHNGIQYFEQQFGLAHQFVIVPEHEQQPGIRHLLEVRGQVEALQPSCLLNDVNSNAATINTVFQNQRVNQATVDSLGEAIAVTRDGYQGLLETLANTMQQCLSLR